jgi:hypothetical protein
MGIKEGEEVQAKGICNIFNKIIAENFPNLEKKMPIQVQEVSRIPDRHDQNRVDSIHSILSLKQLAQKQRSNIKGCRREKSNNI